MKRAQPSPAKIILLTAFLISLTFTCLLFVIVYKEDWLPETTVNAGQLPEETITLSANAIEGELPIKPPTPNPPRALPTLRAESIQYTVQAGDYLNQIARMYGVSVEAVVQANDLAQPDLLEIGQVLIIPPQVPIGTGPAFKIIPDSELVYGPASAEFDLADFIQKQGGYLARYEEEVDNRNMNGTEIVERIAQEFSVNPRLLLAALEFQSGWVTQASPDKSTLEYPLGMIQQGREGLYHQLAWAADNLNRGYYLWRVNGVAAWSLSDGALAAIDPTINAGTAGVQHYLAQLRNYPEWMRAAGRDGFAVTYRALFGDPFQYAVEPLLPQDLVQPEMQLPFERGKRWAFTGGPHGGWGSGSAWAALDFAPPGNALGCVQSNAWVAAVADGLIVRSGDGAVVQDLDSDGLEQTGWTVLYMHIESRQRVDVGTYLKAGDRVGHPSCEGGFSSGTHLHLARRYNGEWIPADQEVPFVLDGWVSVGLGREYDGLLRKDGRTVEAWEGRRPENEIKR